jgi:hypothetical protein
MDLPSRYPDPMSGLVFGSNSIERRLKDPLKGPEVASSLLIILRPQLNIPERPGPVSKLSTQLKPLLLSVERASKRRLCSWFVEASTALLLT